MSAGAVDEKEATETDRPDAVSVASDPSTLVVEATEADVAHPDAVSSVAAEATVPRKAARLPNARELIQAFEQAQMKPVGTLPQIFVGDTVRVGVKIKEGGKERVQPYEGVVIAKRHGGLNATITVRRVFQGIGVERVFMLHSPQTASVKVERRGKVRRAKLFYLRNRVGKATRVKQRFDRDGGR